MHDEETQKLHAEEFPHAETESKDVYDTEPKLHGSARQGFIKKVYSILCVQLCLTAAIVMLGVLNMQVKLFMLTNPAIAIVCAVVAIISMYALACYPSVARSVPLNYIMLTIFTLSEAYLV